MKPTDAIGRTDDNDRKVSEIVAEMEAPYDCPSGHAQAQPEKEEPAR